MPDSDFEEPDASQTVEVTISGSVPAVLDSADLRCLDETISSEMRLLLESDGPTKQGETEVRIVLFCTNSSIELLVII